MPTTVENRALVIDLLEWIAAGSPRPYGEVMEAWRTSCPRLTIWEDALGHGFLVRRHDRAAGPLVEITPKGQQFLARCRRGATSC